MNRTPVLALLLAAALAPLLPAPARAQSAPVIVIRDTAAGRHALTLSGLRTDGTEAARLFTQVLANDLRRSGWFQVVDAGAGIQVSGQVRGQGAFAATAQVALADGRSFGWSESGALSEVRPAAHRFADEIVSRLLGKRGMASAPILLVGIRDGSKEIYRCDSDGGRLMQLTSDRKVCMSPAWMPDRSGFLYTAWLRGAPVTYQVAFQSDGQMRRRTFSSLPGLNTGAVPNPAGTHACIVLSVSGNPELYLMNLANGKLTRITNTPHANEASPEWSPDGNWIAYTSDSSRSPQLHVIARGAKEGKRLVYGLKESVAPSWGPNGQIAFCGRGDRYGIYVTDMSGKYKKVSPDGPADFEDPSWAPDGRHIVCTRNEGGRRRLIVLDTMGDAPWELVSAPGDWYLADWAR